MSLSIRRRLVALTALAAIALSGAVVAITLLARRTNDQRFARARETVLREAERLRDTDDDPLGESPAAASALAIDPFARVSTGILDGALHDPRTARPLAAGLRDPIERAARASLRTGLAAVAEGPAHDARVIAAAAVLPEGGFAWAAMHVPSPRGVERWQLGVWALSASMVLLVILALQTVFALRAGARTLNRSLATLSTDLGARVERPQVAELRDVSDGIAALADKLQLARREHDRLSAELASRERLASLGRVAAGIAHEVRNPLASIKLRTDLAQRVPNVPDAVAKDLRDVSGEIDRLDRLVTDLLAVARRRRTERAPADLAVLIRERVDQLAAWARERDVSLEVAIDMPATVTVERDSIARAVDNLLRNAIEASPVGGSVSVSLSRADDAACITVRDAGAGVPADKLPQLFEPFFTTKSTGTGLGLALTRSIAEAHDGTVEYAHDSGGTRFTLRLSCKLS